MFDCTVDLGLGGRNLMGVSSVYERKLQLHSREKSVFLYSPQTGQLSVLDTSLCLRCCLFGILSQLCLGG